MSRNNITGTEPKVLFPRTYTEGLNLRCSSKNRFPGEEEAVSNFSLGEKLFTSPVQFSALSKHQRECLILFAELNDKYEEYKY